MHNYEDISCRFCNLFKRFESGLYQLSKKIF